MGKHLLSVEQCQENVETQKIVDINRSPHCRTFRLNGKRVIPTASSELGVRRRENSPVSVKIKQEAYGTLKKV